MERTVTIPLEEYELLKGIKEQLEKDNAFTIERLTWKEQIYNVKDVPVYLMDAYDKMVKNYYYVKEENSNNREEIKKLRDALKRKQNIFSRIFKTDNL